MMQEGELEIEEEVSSTRVQRHRRESEMYGASTHNSHEHEDECERVLQRLLKESMAEIHKDLAYNILSNSLFLTASAIYVIVAIWDWKGIPLSFEKGYISYMVLAIIAPSIYFINGVIDICWTLRKRRQLDHQNEELLIVRENQSVASSHSHGKTAPPKNRAEALLLRLTTHPDHRRGLWTAFFFTMASASGLAAAVLSFGLIDIAKELDLVSLLLFLLSAVSAMCGGRDPATTFAHEASIWNDANQLKNLADMAFGMGCAVDLTLYVATENLAAILWPISGTFLWIIGGLLYLRADTVTHFKKLKAVSTKQTIDAIEITEPGDDSDLILSSAASAGGNVRRNYSFAMV